MGRAVAITGGARGIGAATARAFLSRGFRVAIGDIDAELVARTAAAIGVDSAGNIVGLPLDVTDPAGFARFLRDAEAALGGLDVLVNNAGIMPTGAYLDEVDGVTDRLIDINIRGVLTGTKLAGRTFAARGGGHIVNLGSIAGHGAAPGVATYCATKYAVVGFGAALHQELAASGVKVTTICPGLVNTELISGLSPNWFIRRIAYVEPEDVADAIVKAVEKGRGGNRFVPRISGVSLRTMSLLPENWRNRVSGWMGFQDITLEADESEREGYRARTESLDLASVRDRERRAAS